MPEEYYKIDRIESAVVALEKDVAVMSEYSSRIAKAVEVLADMRLEVELLKQKVETNNNIYLENFTALVAKAAATEHEVYLLSTTSTRNTLITESITKFTWIAITSIIGYVVWVLGHLGKT